MQGWLSSTKRKKHQRHMNACVRELNKSLHEDPLWNGRFYVHQTRAEWYAYEDGSGGELIVWLEVVDNSTGDVEIKAASSNHWCSFWGWDLFQFVNDFINRQTYGI